MTKKERLEWLKQIEKDIYVCSLESTIVDDMKSCAIHSIIGELEQKPIIVNHITESKEQSMLDELYYITPSEFKKMMVQISNDDDTEYRHIAGDRLMLRALVSAGYGEGAKIFESFDKWYS